MSVASASAGVHRSETVASSRARNERRVIFASSARHRVRVVRLLSLRHAGAVLRGHCSFRRATRRRRCCRPSRPTPRASWCAPSAPWCSAAWATWSAASTPSWSPSCSWARRPSWSACCRPTRRRLAGAGAVLAAPAPGPGAGRRVWRCGDLRRRACAARPPRLRHELDPDHGHARPLPVAAGHRRSAAPRWTPRRSPTGAGACRSCVSLILLVVLGLDPAASSNELPVFPQMKAEGKGSKSPLTRELPALSEQPSSCCWPCSARTAGQGVVWYTGQFYALFFLTQHAEARLR